jgi:hypothetical protein
MPAGTKPRNRERTTGTPRPEHVHRVEAGLLARGSLPASGLPRLVPSGAVPRWLTAHSCGGSAGLVPTTRSDRTGFPLGSRDWKVPGEPRQSDYGRSPTVRQVKYKDIFILLYYWNPPVPRDSSRRMQASMVRQACDAWCALFATRAARTTGQCE